MHRGKSYPLLRMTVGVRRWEDGFAHPGDRNRRVAALPLAALNQLEHRAKELPKSDGWRRSSSSLFCTLQSMWRNIRIIILLVVLAGVANAT